MAAERTPFYTPEQYLELERDAETKSEYLSGQIFAMAGASPRHNAIAFNIAAGLGGQFRGRPCRGYGSDQRVTVLETGLRTYPDVSAVCREPEFDPLDENALINPTVLIEVLSPRTEAYDRGEKFAHFRRLPSLREYVLVAQDKMRVEHFVRQDDGRWLLAELNDPDEVLTLDSVGCRLPLAEIYDKVALNEEGAGGVHAPGA